MADLVLRAATLVDGTGADPCHDSDIVVRDGVITHIGPAGVYADDAVVVDYGDATIMPGLIDCHCHLQFGAHESHERTLAAHKSASNEQRVMTAIVNGQRALATGVTTLRDTGGYLTLNMLVRDALRAGQVLGPRLLVCGAPITTTGGHLNWCGLRADSRDEVIRAVRRMVQVGADFIKVMATGGMMTPGSQAGRSQYDLETLRALVTDAHRLRRHVAAHVLGADGCRDAIDAGVDTLEHCSWLTPEGIRGETVMDEAAVERVDAAHQSVHMTLAAMNRTPFRDLAHLDALPANERERIRAAGANFRYMRETRRAPRGVQRRGGDRHAVPRISALGHQCRRGPGHDPGGRHPPRDRRGRPRYRPERPDRRSRSRASGRSAGGGRRRGREHLQHRQNRVRLPGRARGRAQAAPGNSGALARTTEAGVRPDSGDQLTGERCVPRGVACPNTGSLGSACHLNPRLGESQECAGYGLPAYLAWENDAGRLLLADREGSVRRR